MRVHRGHQLLQNDEGIFPVVVLESDLPRVRRGFFPVAVRIKSVEVVTGERHVKVHHPLAVVESVVLDGLLDGQGYSQIQRREIPQWTLRFLAPSDDRPNFVEYVVDWGKVRRHVAKYRSGACSGAATRPSLIFQP